MLDDADRQAERLVERAHPLGVALGQVVVHRDDVHAAPGEGIQIGGEGRHQRLALPGGHLRDGPPMEHHAADELDVEVPHAERPARRLAAHRERLGEQGVQGLARPGPRPERIGLFPQGRAVEGRRASLQPLMAATTGWARLTSRSCLVPKIFFRTLSSMPSHYTGCHACRCLIPARPDGSSPSAPRPREQVAGMAHRGLRLSPEHPRDLRTRASPRAPRPRHGPARLARSWSPAGGGGPGPRYGPDASRRGLAGARPPPPGGRRPRQRSDPRCRRRPRRRSRWAVVGRGQDGESASIVRDSSPPEATRASGFGSSPGLAARRNSTRSDPRGDIAGQPLERDAEDGVVHPEGRGSRVPRATGAGRAAAARPSDSSPAAVSSSA